MSEVPDHIDIPVGRWCWHCGDRAPLDGQILCEPCFDEAAALLAPLVLKTMPELTEAKGLLQLALTVHDVVGDDAEGAFESVLEDMRAFLEAHP